MHRGKHTVYVCGVMKGEKVNNTDALIHGPHGLRSVIHNTRIAQSYPVPLFGEHTLKSFSALLKLRQKRNKCLKAKHFVKHFGQNSSCQGYPFKTEETHFRKKDFVSFLLLIFSTAALKCLFINTGVRHCQYSSSKTKNVDPSTDIFM